MNYVDNKIDEFKKRKLCEIKSIVSKLENKDPRYINERFTLTKDTLKKILEQVVYSDPNISLPTPQQKASWNRSWGVSIKKVLDYIVEDKKEKYFLTGRI